jgi:hypothetical protein
MTPWQRRARFSIAIVAVAFAIVVAFTLKRRPQPPAQSAARTDPGAVVEVTGGRVERFKLSRQDVRVAYGRQLTYENGSTKLMDVTITADERAGGAATVTGNRANVAQKSTQLMSGRAAGGLGRNDGEHRARYLFRQRRRRPRDGSGGVLPRTDDRIGNGHDVRHDA